MSQYFLMFHHTTIAMLLVVSDLLKLTSGRITHSLICFNTVVTGTNSTILLHTYVGIIVLYCN